MLKIINDENPDNNLESSCRHFYSDIRCNELRVVVAASTVQLGDWPLLLSYSQMQPYVDIPRWISTYNLGGRGLLFFFIVK
jgi:hypothetical protein